VRRSESRPASARSSGRRRRPSGRLFAHDRGFSRGLVAGVDEAGRGCLAGPLVAAAVVIDLGRLSRRGRLALSDLDDSKRLSAARREALTEALWRYADQVVVLSASSATIDRDGLHVTNLRLMRAALGRLDPRPDAALVDGFALGADAPAHRRVIGGDRKSACIAAASVVAKTTRDRLMTGPATAAYPDFGFDAHVGYSTPEHQAALRELGLSPLHRRSFQSVAYPSLQLFDPATASSSAPGS
jgi:ribonuclease HII